MEKHEFLNQIKDDIASLLSNDTLSNYKNQAFAWKLNAKFKRTFQENFLFEKALFLSTNSCYLIQNKFETEIAIKGLTVSAELFSTLSELPDIFIYYDKEFLQILSALCFDLAGYQANSYCIANRIKEYRLSTLDTSISLNSDNAILDQIRLILLKKIPQAKTTLYRNTDLKEKGYTLFQNAISSWYALILDQVEGNYQTQLHDTYLSYLYSGNTYIAHLLLLLKTRIILFEERSIWKILSTINSTSGNHQWKKYTKLLSYDLYEINSIRKIDQRKSIFEFWTSQIRAIEKGILEFEENFVVQMPTSAGKTLIAELLILKYLTNVPNKKCIYIAPFRALTHEKEIELSKNLSKLGYSVSSLSGNYEIDEFQNLILEETDLLIATPEKIDLLLRQNPQLFENVSLVVVDEGHIIGEISPRATLLEFLIIRLKIKTPEIKLLFISAVMPPNNANEYSLWLSNKETNVLRSLKFKNSSIDDEWEPTRKLISSFQWETNGGNITFQNVTTKEENAINSKGAILYSFLKEGEFGNKYPKKKNKVETAAALAFKMSNDGSTLVFCAQVRRIKSVAKALIKIFSVTEIPDRFRYNIEKKSSYYSKLWYGENSYITEAINNGVGIHFGDMPEQVRNAVEDDFSKGLLSILLSTNTIGQGLNFPIKNLIFYETQISRTEENNTYIQKRDFWNIVGRAGRANKEIEGRIVFIINSSNDRNLYKSFTKKENIENANSFFFQALDLLTAKRIKEDYFFEIISILAETYLLDLLTEEIIGTDYEEIINRILSNSLFKIQIEKKNLDINFIKKGFYNTFKSFEADSSYEILKIFNKTGLSFKSNKLISEFIDLNMQELNGLLENDNYIGVLRFFLEFISDNILTEINYSKLADIKIKPTECQTIIQGWINSETIQTLIKLWVESTGLEIEAFHSFIAQALTYLYPWIISSFLQILAFKAEIEFQNLPANIKNLPNYIKYGINSNLGCLAMSLGIKSRNVAKLLSTTPEELTEINFIKWISNLLYNEIDTFQISEYDKDNVKDVAIRLTTQRFSIFPEIFEFHIKGTNFNSDWSITSKTVKVGDELTYRREEDNNYDPFAIQLLKGENIIGYIPREYSKKIATEIDIENNFFSIFVENTIVKDGFNEIQVRMTKVIE